MAVYNSEFILGSACVGSENHALAFVLDADILSRPTCCDVTRVTFLRDNNCQSCLSLFSYSVNNIHLIIVLAAESDTANFPRFPNIG